MRVAVLLKEKCQPKKCNHECEAFCPINRQGAECIVIPVGQKPIISEPLCIGCGICVNKCPFDAIRIIGLPAELEDDMVHRYGENAFRLFRLPVPRSGSVTGILGPNGIGKSTSLRILSGEEIPNLGDWANPKPTWDPILAKYKGTELGDYLKRVADKKIRAATKPQNVDKLPKVYKGNVGELLKKVDEINQFDDVVPKLDLAEAVKRDVADLSGGELQRVAVAATLLRDADVYFFDEPSSYLDIRQRLRVARVIEELATRKQVLVIEHDLALLDALAENVHLIYGEEGAYGVFTPPKNVRHGINLYLEGFLKEENIRVRDAAIEFASHPPKRKVERIDLITYAGVEKTFEGFTLTAPGGTLHHGEVVGVVGPNATGKTTFVKILAGVLKPDKGEIQGSVKVSYKPQYIRPDWDGTLRDLILSQAPDLMTSSFLQSEVYHPLQLQPLLDKAVKNLSGGELQRSAIALALARPADIYLLDEPSAYLDSNQRMVAARTIRRVLEKEAKAGFVVDHDVYFIDMVSDSLMVFGGEPGFRGHGEGPYDMRAGMNKFLADLDVTFRRDPDSHRPRINKRESRLDRTQRSEGEYYYKVAA